MKRLRIPGGQELYGEIIRNKWTIIEKEQRKNGRNKLNDKSYNTIMVAKPETKHVRKCIQYIR